MRPPYRFKIVRDSDAADFGSVRVTLFVGEFDVCGWYISPVGGGSLANGYAPKSDNLVASSAVLRAIAQAEELGVGVCIIDPDGLWPRVWGGGPDVTQRYRGEGL